VPERIVDRLDLDRHWDRATVERNLVDSPDHAARRADLHAATAAHAARRDTLIPWQDLIRREGRAYGVKSFWKTTRAP